MRIRKNLNGTMGRWDNGTNGIDLHFFNRILAFCKHIFTSYGRPIFGRLRILSYLCH